MGERRVRVVLQSRLSSSRLPGKAMLGVGGRPMVVLAAQRAGSAGAEVVVATSDRAEDDVIAAAVTQAGLAVVRGPLDDPLRRFAIATEDLADDDVVVRLTADNVVPDGSLVALLVAEIERDAEYARLGGDDPALPYGVAGEAFTVSALRSADAEAVSSHDREHVTPLLREVHGDRRIDVPDVAPGWAGLRCTVDTLDDYVALVRVLSGVEDPVVITWRALCERVAALSPSAPRFAVRCENPVGQGPLVLGTVQLGVAYGAANTTGLPDPTLAADVLAKAVAERITHLDTARAYGASEARIGAGIARGLGEHLGVVTKVRPLDDIEEGAPQGWGQEAVRASVEASLRALGASSVDALLVHRAADWSRPGVRTALLALRAEGSVRLVGASLSNPEELVTLLTDPELGYVQLPFNLMDRRWLAPEVLVAFQERPEVVVTCRSVYLQGLLTSGEARWPANAGADPAAIAAGVASLVTELDRDSAADLCLAYVLGHRWVTSVVVGAETPDQVRENARLCRRAPLDAAGIARVQEVLPVGSDELVDPALWRTS